MNADIQRILEKLALVRRRGLTCFGSDAHQFRLKTPIAEGEIAAFEQTHRIRLPEDYRAFLRWAGNGGAGPYYGILPLSRWNDAALEDVPDYLARPSPLRPQMPVGVEWEEALNCRWEELLQGTLALVEQGCAYYALLVVTGDYRGRVVYVNLDRGGVPYFVHNVDFLSWYERWLDELLWGYEGSWFGAGLPGREDDLAAVLRSADSDVGRLAEALGTLLRIPHLKPATLEAVLAVSRGEAPPLRRHALHLLAKHAKPDAARTATALLADPDVEVRKAALTVLADVKLTRWELVARDALHDPDPNVVFTALCKLKDAGFLTRDDVLPLLQSAHARVRSDALWASESVREGQGSVDIPDHLFYDADEVVRLAAIRAVGKTKDPSKVALLIDRLALEPKVDTLSRLIDALGAIRAPQAVPALLELTKHADAFVRQDTAKALGKIGDRRAIPALQALLADKVKPERRDEGGSISNMFSVAHEARKALARIEKR
jgi:HEAT repeat protein